LAPSFLKRVGVINPKGFCLLKLKKNQGGRKTLLNHPHLNPLPSRERRLKPLLPWREKAGMRGIYITEAISLVR
jgi:hypothetical protein